MQNAKVVLYVGNMAITDHIRQHLHEITSNPAYHSPPPRPSDEEVIKKYIKDLKDNSPKEENMNMKQMRKFAIELMTIMVPDAKFKTRYSNQDNKPKWFPTDLIWQQMNLFNHDQLRRIISACYGHLGIQVPIYPSDTRKISTQSQYTQTSSHISSQVQNPPVDENTKDKFQVFRKFINSRDQQHLYPTASNVPATTNVPTTTSESTNVPITTTAEADNVPITTTTKGDNVPITTTAESDNVSITTTTPEVDNVPITTTAEADNVPITTTTAEGPTQSHPSDKNVKQRIRRVRAFISPKLTNVAQTGPFITPSSPNVVNRLNAQSDSSSKKR